MIIVLTVPRPNAFLVVREHSSLGPSGKIVGTIDQTLQGTTVKLQVMASLGDYRSCFKTQATSRQEASYGQKRSELGDADANAAGNRKTSSFRNRNSGRSTEVHDGPENR